MTEPEVGDPSVVMKVVKERFTRLLHHDGADLAEAVLRFQRLQFGETHREASVHASQSREARSRNSTRGLEMEQLQGVRLRRRGLGKGQLSRMALDHQLFCLAIPLIRKPRMSGAPAKTVRCALM